ncbi:MAG: hypothetical protein DRJ46_01730 [Thermoprotei archaeon]|nr:MAG: hypothetical protein DRJ46_01730 [Thermoprotei archaeon]
MSFFRSLFRTFYVSPEEEILKLVIQHSAKCKEAAEKLMQAVETALKGEAPRREIEAVENAEREADKIRRKILDQLATGALPPLGREDFVRLVERVDMVADWARDAVRVLKSMKDLASLKAVEKPLISLTLQAERSAQRLHEAITVMGEDLEKTRELVIDVEKIEDVGDWAYMECLEALSEKWSQIKDPLVLVLIQSVENVVDSAEDASDVLEEITIRALR